MFKKRYQRALEICSSIDIPDRSPHNLKKDIKSDKTRAFNQKLYLVFTTVRKVLKISKWGNYFFQRDLYNPSQAADKTTYNGTSIQNQKIRLSPDRLSSILSPSHEIGCKSLSRWLT
jgi:hypothetical protein